MNPLRSNTLFEWVDWDFNPPNLSGLIAKMYRAGVPIEIIARKFGHSDTRTTMRYLGLDFEDLSAAEDLYAKYQASLICPKKGTFEVSQEISGQGGI